MTRHAFNVADTFEIQGRGVIVTTDKCCEDLPQWLKLKIGDEVELRSAGKTVLTRVAGIGIKWTPKNPFEFLLPAEIPKDQVTFGSEIWVSESSVVNRVKDK